MRKTLFLSIITLFFLSIVANAQEKRPATLPNFSFMLDEKTPITQDFIQAGKPIIVFFFDPFCDHCQTEAERINKEFTKFKDVQLLWVSTESFENIANFKKKYFPNAKGLLAFARDTKFKFDDYFGYSVIPSMYIFDKNHKFVKEYHNDVSASLLLSPLGIK